MIIVVLILENTGVMVVMEVLTFQAKTGSDSDNCGKIPSPYSFANFTVAIVVVTNLRCSRLFFAQGLGGLHRRRTRSDTTEIFQALLCSFSFFHVRFWSEGFEINESKSVDVNLTRLYRLSLTIAIAASEVRTCTCPQDGP